VQRFILKDTKTAKEYQPYLTLICISKRNNPPLKNYNYEKNLNYKPGPKPKTRRDDRRRPFDQLKHPDLKSRISKTKGK